MEEVYLSNPDTGIPHSIATEETQVEIRDILMNAAADYAQISGNDDNTDVTAAELEELSDGSETVLHSHAGEGGGGITLTAYTNLDSESNAMLPSYGGDTHAYKAVVAGWVTFYSVNALDSGQIIRIYVGTTDDPVGAGTLIGTSESFNINTSTTVSAMVAKDEYFECVRSAGGGGDVVLFKGFDTLGNPIDYN